jgi:hypothetical protein
MKSKHTPGPWCISDLVEIKSTHGNIIAVLRHGDRRTKTEEHNALRIVSCVNACEGIYDPSGLRNQRNELLRILEKICSANACEIDCDSDCGIWPEVAAVIAKAKGEIHNG